MMHTFHCIAIRKYVVVGIVIILAALVSSRIVAGQRFTDCTGVCDLAWSPIEENLLGVVDEFGLWLYDANENNRTRQFFPHEHSFSLSFDQQGQYVAVISCSALIKDTNSCYGSISLFDIQEQTWEVLGTYNYGISNVKFSPDGRYIAFQKDEIGAWGIQLIDLAKNETLSIVDRNYTNNVIDYAFDPQSAHIAISNGLYGYEGHDLWGISVWRLSDQVLQASTEGSMLVANLTFTETDTEIMFVQYDTQVSIWNYLTGVILPLGQMTETVTDNLNRLSFSYSSTYLLGSLLDDWKPGDRELYIWNIQSQEQIFFNDTSEDNFTDLIAIDRSGEDIAYSSTVDEQKIVYIWMPTTGVTHQISMSE